MSIGRIPGRALLFGGAVVSTKVALSEPRLSGDSAEVAITWLAVTSFVVIGLALLATSLPSITGWSCLLVGAATVPGDLNDGAFVQSGWTPLGFVLELGYLPAAVALVLRYPGPRLSSRDRGVVWGLVVTAVLLRVPVALTRGSVPDGFYRPSSWPALNVPTWHDQVLVRGGYGSCALLLLLTGALLGRRIVRSRGLLRQALAPLSVVVAVGTVAAAVDRAIWASGDPALRGIPAALVRDLSAAVIPVTLLADLLRRRAAAAAVSEHVIVAAQSGEARLLQAVLRAVLLDPTVQVREPAGAGTDSVETVDTVTVTVHGDDGAPLATVSYDRASADQALWRAALVAVRLGLENRKVTADLLAELRESRARILETAQTERRRVERDLHDGAQQQFLAVAATLAQADLVDDAEIRSVVRQARNGLGEALVDLRQLARGIHPAALTQGGLTAALPTLCTSSSCAVTLSIDPTLRTRRLLPGTESTAYFAVAEALANAHRHARAIRISVTVRLLVDRLDVDVCDDGSGAARFVPHGGLVGLRDRVEASNGVLSLHADPCPDHPDLSGSTVHIELPVSPEAAHDAHVNG